MHNKGGWVSNSEISHFLRINPASVSGMLHKLKNNGYIHWRPRSHIRLTERGKTIAENIYNNYKKLEKFFEEILNIKNKKLIDKLCCGIEHHVTNEIIEALDNLLISTN